MKPEILERQIAHAGYLTVERLRMRLTDGAEVSREVERHGDAVAVLPYDAERRSALRCGRNGRLMALSATGNASPRRLRTGRQGRRLAIGRPTNRLDYKSRPERACNCAAVKAASCSDGTATACTSLMRHMVIEIHWSDGGTHSNCSRDGASGTCLCFASAYDVGYWRFSSIHGIA
jgi:hypothetical protein